MINLTSLYVGDIVTTTDDSGYDKLMLITNIGPYTRWIDGKITTIQACGGPLFDSWHTVKLPTGLSAFPAIQCPPSGWVCRTAEQISGKLDWNDNPMNPDFF